ncbi:hypothetical protein QUB10_17640 [Microcoleus sp. B5-D4]|uniref:hypothetical protein n=1 Tax=unclassified Microcoleus TaxID=2642155 RepID=UPI002FD27A29
MPGVEYLWGDRQSTFRVWYWHMTLANLQTTILQRFVPSYQACSCANLANWTTANGEL